MEWKKWGKIGKWDVVGYKIIEGKKGNRRDKLSKAEYMIIERPWDVIYTHSYGLVSPFFKGLLEKKLMGTSCPICKDVFCPPRAHCWRNECNLQETEWIEMPLKGTLHCYTILGFSAEAFLSDLPFTLAYVRVDGANTSIVGRLKEINPEDVECDMRVKIKFVDEPKGKPTDIYFVPAEKPISRKTEEQKERIRKQLEPIKEWVKKKFGE